MTWKGVGDLARIVGRMDSKQYIEILDLKLRSTIGASTLLPDFPYKLEIIFQQDNNPKHNSAAKKAWILAKNIFS